MTEITTHTIYIVEDHNILMDGLSRIIEDESDLDLIGRNDNGRDALAEIERDKPDLVILDIMLPGMTGLEVTRQLRVGNRDIKIILLSQHDRREYVHDAFSLGANGYVLKQDATEDLIRAIHEVLDGNIYLSPRLTKNFVDGHLEVGRDGTSAILSSRELEVLKLVAEGLSNEQIASILFISPTTVKTHRARIMKKLNVSRVTELVKYAVKSGLVEF